MSDAPHYSMVIEWSDEDDVYVVSLPEWGDLVHTHGDSYGDALRNGRELLEGLVAVRRERGEPLPEPRVFAAASQRMHYSMLIQWSEEDRAFVVSLPEWEDRVFSNPVTHGDTYEEAVRNGREAIEALVGWATEQEGAPLPEPRVFAPVS